jgi:hypothetical protein
MEPSTPKGWRPNCRVDARICSRPNQTGQTLVSARIRASDSGSVSEAKSAAMGDDRGRTYAAVTSRSHHPGGVNAFFAVGSVHFVKNSVSVQTWRAVGTVAGGEVISGDSY